MKLVSKYMLCGMVASGLVSCGKNKEPVEDYKAIIDDYIKGKGEEFDKIKVEKEKIQAINNLFNKKDLIKGTATSNDTKALEEEKMKNVRLEQLIKCSAVADIMTNTTSGYKEKVLDKKNKIIFLENEVENIKVNDPGFLPQLVSNGNLDDFKLKENLPYTIPKDSILIYRLKGKPYELFLFGKDLTYVSDKNELYESTQKNDKGDNLEVKDAGIKFKKKGGTSKFNLKIEKAKSK